MTTLRSRLLVAVVLAALALPVGAGVAFAAPGDLDPTFGTGGKVLTSGVGATRFAVQADGKIVTGTACVTDLALSFDFCLERYTENGSLDTGFGTGGRAQTDFGNTFDNLSDVAVQGDGKIVAAGQCGSPGIFCLARYTASGSLDTSFGTGGRVTTDFAVFGSLSANGRALRIQSDGKIVLAGDCASAPNTYFVSVQDACLARYTSTGALDGSFGSGGRVMRDLAGDDADYNAKNEFMFAAALQADGAIVVAGMCGDFSTGAFCLARFTGSGGFDSSFGQILTPMGVAWSSASDVVVGSGGEITAVGTCLDATTSNVFCIARYNANGSLETTFNGTGKVLTRFVNGGFAKAAALQTNGKLVVAGSCFNLSGSQNFCVARYNGDGSLDSSFGTGGTVMTPMGLSQDYGNDLAVLGNGNLLVGGSCATTTCLARYLGDPTVVGPATVSVTPRDASGSSPGTFIAGNPVHPYVEVAGPAGAPIPTGSVTVSWYANGTCKGGTKSATATLGADGTLDLDSYAQVPTKAGTYSFLASYGGDTVYVPQVSACTPVAVTAKLTPTITTAIHDASESIVTSVGPGTPVHDSVTVTGSIGSPSGTVTIRWFSSGRCKGKVASSSAPLALDAGGAVDATAFTQTPAVAGSYSFQASYSGDATYLSANGPCETLIVQ